MEHSKSRSPDELLAIYGADRRRWPVGTVDSAILAAPSAVAEATSIDRILDHASQPMAPEGSMARLLDRLNEPSNAEIIAFRPGRASKTQFLRYATLPLAASLALGIYLGALGALDVALPTAITGTVALGDEVDDDLGGVGELDVYAEDNVT